MSIFTGRQLAVVDRAASALLEYPGSRPWPDPIVRHAISTLPTGRVRDLLDGFLDGIEGRGASALPEEYVETFDLRRRSCLYLTYYTDGDTRRRGVALGRLLQRYRAAGLVLAADELPDYLPVVLEFAALSGERDVLEEHRPSLELLRLALEERGSRYARVVEAVCATLPGPSPADRAAVVALAASGPPNEEVGLEPYAVPGGSYR